jgi:hypothetical protein
MKHRITQVMVSTGCGLLVWMAATILPISAPPAWAGVDVHINLGVPPVVVEAPPPVVVEEPPTMVFLPEPGIYVAIGVPYDIFFISGRYYYFRGGNWFWAGGYGGPWTHVVYRSLPPGLRRYKIERLHEFREREHKVYRAQGPKFQGKHFAAVPGPKAREQRKEQSKNEHMKRGKND